MITLAKQKGCDEMEQIGRRRAAVVSVTEARLVNPLTSRSTRSRVISALGRYNQRCSVEDEFV
jgi:hypothetical protein